MAQAQKITPRAKDFSEWRSEEHTSELQSHSDLVCRLLLEKKNSNGSLGSQPALVLAATKSRTERHKSQRVRTGGAQRPLRSRAQRYNMRSHRLCLAVRCS